MGEKLEVSDKVFMEAFDVTPVKLARLKSLAKNRGYFEYDNYKYYLDKEAVTRNACNNKLIKPADTKTGRQRRFIITNIIDDENMPPRSSYHTYVLIDSKKIELREFTRIINISLHYFGRYASTAKSLILNGTYIEFIRERKNKSKYTVINNNNGDIYHGLFVHEAQKIVGCEFHKFYNMADTRPKFKYQNFEVRKELC